MVRVFLDASVLFSAAYGSPGPAGLWTLAEEGKLSLLTSAYALEEARRNVDQEEHRRRLLASVPRKDRSRARPWPSLSGRAAS